MNGSPEQAFEGMAEAYESLRPRYPRELLTPLVAAVGVENGALLVDVGAGTGISTRQLRRVFGPGPRVLGVEPGTDMRREAERTTPGELSIEYRAGTAERLPLADCVAALALAAQSMQWFDRPTFLAEARRVLRSGGVLAVLQNDRDWRSGEAAAGFEDFLERHSPGYSRDYRSFPIGEELAAAPGFRNVRERHQHWERTLKPDEFVGWALTSSKTQGAVEAIGLDAARRKLAAIAQRSAGSGRAVVLPYVTRLYWATRDAQ